MSRSLLPLKPRVALLSAAIAGACLPLAFAPFGVSSLAVVSPALLWLLWGHTTPAQAARLGFCWGVGAFLAGTYWLYISIHIFGQAPAPVAILLMLALVAIMAGYFAAVGYLQARTRLRGGWLWLLYLPCAWVLIEWVRGWLFSGFPWLSLGYAFADGWLAGYGPVLGVYGISLAAAILAGAGVALLRGSFAVRALAVIVAAAVIGGGLLLSRISWVEPIDRELRVALVQGAVSQDRKWLAEQLAPTKALYRDLSLPFLDYDLIVWPEAAIPSMIDQEHEYLELMRSTAEVGGADIMLGMLEYEPNTGSYFNSLLVLGEPPAIYRKRHLVPFGEYFPVPAFVREWMRLMSLPYVDIAKGSSEPEPLEVAGLYAAASICYEDAFGEEQRVFLPKANLLVNVSNDAWFGDSIAPHQHLQIARMRAIEAGRFMLRATNTGISAVIAPDGRLLAVSPQFETDVLTATIRPYTGATPYVLIGDGWLWLVALIGLGASLIASRRRSA